jgi:RHS repeat-associated protein
VSSANVSGGGTTIYVYNALGALIEKSGYTPTTLIVYDESRHVLGEYSSTGALQTETIWMGDLPVAALQPSGSTVAVYYIHTDHLGIARRITQSTDNALRYLWDEDTFGGVAPNYNPSNLGVFTYNLRFPGQYRLIETGLYSNYFRTYDSSTGRYLESDPIGLRGGINTYGYVNADPIALVDPSGLVRWKGAYNYTSGGLAHLGVRVASTGFTFVLKSDCTDGKMAIVRVDALAGGAGTGLSLFGPYTIGASTVTFQDNLSSLNPNIFEGAFSYSNFGTVFASATAFTLGGALGDGGGLNASTSILDISEGKGSSRLTWARFQNCGCGTNNW